MVQLNQDFKEFFKEEQIDAIARATNFCQRKRKITPQLFLEALAFKDLEGSSQSIQDHCLSLRLEHGIKLSKQSLDERFNQKSVAFLKEVLSGLIKARVENVPDHLTNKFSEIFIQDSTRFGLPSSFKESYPCFGGKGAKAGAAIQFVYGLGQSRFHFIDLKPAIYNDCVYNNNDWIKKGSLVLRDLGYFSNELFKEIINKEAFFVSRVKPKTVMYTNDTSKTRIDLKKVITRMKTQKTPVKEVNILLSTKDKIPLRAFIYLVPEEVRTARIERVQKNAKERKWTMQEEYKLWAGINVYITNASDLVITNKDIPLLYKLRWQIELLFKCWKSNYRIHKHKSMKKERLECYIYASLIQIIIHWKIIAALQCIVWKESQELISIQKTVKTLIRFKTEIKKCITNNLNEFKHLLIVLYDIVKSSCLLERKACKIGMKEIIKKCKIQFIILT